VPSAFCARSLAWHSDGLWEALVTDSLHLPSWGTDAKEHLHRPVTRRAEMAARSGSGLAPLPAMASVGARELTPCAARTQWRGRTLTACRHLDQRSVQ
jgi:hypothetical protein